MISWHVFVIIFIVFFCLDQTSDWNEEIGDQTELILSRIESLNMCLGKMMRRLNSFIRYYTVSMRIFRGRSTIVWIARIGSFNTWQITKRRQKKSLNACDDKISELCQILQSNDDGRIDTDSNFQSLLKKNLDLQVIGWQVKLLKDRC